MKEALSMEEMELHAYVDGQLGAEGRHRVEAYLEAHPEVRQQIEDYQLFNEHIKQLYDPIADEPLPPRFRDSRPRWNLWRPLRSLAAAALLLTLGLSLGLYLGTDLEVAEVAHEDDIQHMVDVTVMAYTVYTPEVRHPVEVGADEEPYLVEWLSRRMGTRIHVPKLDQLGMQLLGGRLLSTEYGPGGLLMYEDSGGRRIVLYACPSDEKPTAFHYVQQNDVSVFYWIDRSLSYAVAGEMPREKLLPLARSVYDQLM
jgi:anti-sigma factor RsiW